MNTFLVVASSKLHTGDFTLAAHSEINKIYEYISNQIKESIEKNDNEKLEPNLYSYWKYDKNTHTFNEGIFTNEIVTYDYNCEKINTPKYILDGLDNLVIELDKKYNFNKYNKKCKYNYTIEMFDQKTKEKKIIFSFKETDYVEKLNKEYINQMIDFLFGKLKNDYKEHDFKYECDYTYNRPTFSSDKYKIFVDILEDDNIRVNDDKRIKEIHMSIIKKLNTM